MAETEQNQAESQQENQPEAVQRPTSIDQKRERTWAGFCHLAGLAWFIPFGNIIGPLVIWLLKKDEFTLLDNQGKEAVNFQISVTIYAAVCIATIIAMPLALAVLVFDVVMIIVATIKANEGQKYRYPLCIRFIK